MPWFGTRACQKKNFRSPQWLRDVKTKKYPFWRLDILFSKKKYYNIHYVNDGGWHFTNIKTPENIQKKLLNYTHHDEFERSGISLEDLKNKIEEKKAIYDFQPMQPGDIKESYADIEKTVSKLNYSPKISINGGIPKFISWYMNYYKINI